MYPFSLLVPLRERDISHLDLCIHRDIWLSVFGEPFSMWGTDGELETILLSEVGLHVLSCVAGETWWEDERGISVSVFQERWILRKLRMTDT